MTPQYWRKYEFCEKRLHSVIKYILVNRSDDGQSPLPPVIRIFPETEISFFIDFAGSFTNGNGYLKTAINGIHSEYYYLAHGEKKYFDKMMIVFQPGGLKYFTSLPLLYLKNQLMAPGDASDFGMSKMNKVFEQMADFRTTLERISFLEKQLLKLMVPPKESTVLSNFIAESISGNGRLLNHGELNHYTSIGLRQLQRNFLRDMGVNMKLFLKISRFQKSKQWLLHNCNRSIFNAWYDSGYYDQPQFNRNFKLLSGLLPSDFINTDDICSEKVPALGTFLSNVSP